MSWRHHQLLLCLTVLKANSIHCGEGEGLRMAKWDVSCCVGQRRSDCQVRPLSCACRRGDLGTSPLHEKKGECNKAAGGLLWTPVAWGMFSSWPLLKHFLSMYCTEQVTLVDLRCVLWNATSRRKRLGSKKIVPKEKCWKMAWGQTFPLSRDKRAGREGKESILLISTQHAVHTAAGGDLLQRP